MSFSCSPGISTAGDSVLRTYGDTWRHFWPPQFGVADATQYPVAYKAAPHHKHYLAPNSAEVEKPVKYEVTLTDLGERFQLTCRAISPFYPDDIHARFTSSEICMLSILDARPTLHNIHRATLNSSLFLTSQTKSTSKFYKYVSKRLAEPNLYTHDYHPNLPNITSHLAISAASQLLSSGYSPPRVISFNYS